jgi:serine/threonine-protein kinase
MYGLFTGKIPNGRFPEPAELNPEVSAELNQIILQCLSSDPRKRPKSAESLKMELLSISQGAHLDNDQRMRAERGITKIRSKFMLLDVLREDKYGAVYLYQQKEKNNLLIIKKKLVDTNGFEANNILASLEHPNIVNTLATSRTDEFFILVQEYLSGGTLQDKLAFQLNWQETLKIAKQICEAMIFAHNNHIIHGHLRPTNILFTPEGDVKVTDFSLQDDVTDIETAHYYHLSEEERSQAADIYSVGVLWGICRILTAVPKSIPSTYSITKKGLSSAVKPRSITWMMLEWFSRAIINDSFSNRRLASSSKLRSLISNLMATGRCNES